MLEVSVLDTVIEPASEVTFIWGSVELRYSKGLFKAHVVYPDQVGVTDGKFFITQIGSRQYFDMCINPTHPNVNAKAMEMAGHTFKELTGFLEGIPKDTEFQ